MSTSQAHTQRSTPVPWDTSPPLDHVAELEAQFERTAATIRDLFRDYRRANRRAELATAKAGRTAELIGELEVLQSIRRGQIARLRNGIQR